MQAPAVNTPTPTATPRRDAPVRRANRFRCDRRGSAIILVVVAIVLMAILGATFVQITRFERIDTGGEHIDIAINSVLNEVAVVLAEDLYDDSGNFFNHVGSDRTDGGGDEPFDYAWTDSTIAERAVVFVDGTGGTAEGGVYDDPWLAEAFAMPPGGVPIVWPHLSDLTGRFLDVGHRDLTLVGQTNPGEVASTAADVTNIPVDYTNSPHLVDADGDGIGDSLWAYCPAAEIAGKRYVYAIRIIDLSSKVNINTALGMTDGAGNIVGNPRGDSPAEVDATGLAAILAANGETTVAAAVNEVNQTIAQRYGGSATVPVAWGDATDERRHYWLNGSSLVNTALVNQATDVNYDPTDRYGQSDLLELLYKNGLNNTALVTPLEDDMPTLLRRDNAEFVFDDTAMPFNIHSGSRANFYTNRNPRILFTTESGAMVVAPPAGTPATLIGPDHDSDGTGERILKADINHSSLADLTEVIEDTLSAGGSFDGTNFGHLAVFTEFASQLAANIVDMRDPDNQLTTHNGQTGMEALPFVSEVYVQRAYAAVVSAETPVGSGVWTHQYSVGAPANYVIELRNPFSKPVSLENVYLYLDGSPFGGTGGELSTFPGVPADNLLQPGAAMFIYLNGAGEDMLNGYAPAGNDIDSPITDAWPIGSTTVQVELRGEEQGTGTTLAWPYCGVIVNGVENIPNGWETTNSMVAAPLPGGANNAFYIQHSYHGTDGVNLLQCEPSDFGPQTDEPESYDGTMIEVGSTSKTREPTVAGGQFAGDWNGGDMQWLFLDKQTSATDTDGRIPYVADVLTIPVVGPNDPGTANTTLASAIELSGVARLDDLMLDYRASTAPVISVASPSLNVPHAVLLLERLTTHSPAVDGFDLDGDGVDVTAGGTPDYDEVYVPGKINLNTASLNVLLGALPFPTTAQRNAVALRIFNFRDSPGVRPATARSNTQPGIAYTGELYELLTADLAGLNPQPDWNDHQVGGMTSDTTFLVDNITGDREEDLMLAKWLNEVCTTRSDVFAVYLVVQGFPEGNFGAGALESARVVAVFSRANVRQAGDKAQLIAVRRIE